MRLEVKRMQDLDPELMREGDLLSFSGINERVGKVTGECVETHGLFVRSVFKRIYPIREKGEIHLSNFTSRFYPEGSQFHEDLSLNYGELFRG